MLTLKPDRLTVRNVPTDIAAALAQEQRRRGTSLNQTIIDLLREGLGVSCFRSNGLARLAGTWARREEREFLRRVQTFKEIDPGLWQ
jgi:hypothetical protein